MRIFHGPLGRSLGWEAAVRAALTVGLVICLILAASSARALTITACVNDKNGAVKIISKGTCKKGTTGVVLNPGAIQTLAVQSLNVVDANNHTVATLGKNANGNQLTFFDSSGKQTLTVGNGAGEATAGLETWDGNNIIPVMREGNGVVRTFFGETIGMDPVLGDAFSGEGFGGEVFDANSARRLEFGLQDSTNDAYFTAFNSNGTSTGIGAFQSESFAGYFANDLNGMNRQEGGITLDGTGNDWLAADTNGMIRVVAQQNDSSNAFGLLDQNQVLEVDMVATSDGSAVGFNLLDTNQINRFSALLDQSGSNVDTRDANGNITGHLP